jgi:hypothetical protein
LAGFAANSAGILVNVRARFATMKDTLAVRLKAAAELLEKVANNRALLAELPAEERTRLL